MPAFRFCATKTSEKQTFIFCEKKTIVLDLNTGVLSVRQRLAVPG